MAVKKSELYIIRKSKFPQNPKRSVRFSGKGQNEAFKKGKRATLKKPKQKFCNDLCFGFIIS